jgi:hypothetical protein
MSVIIENRSAPYRTAFVKYGIGYGAVAAMILSYNANQSILWMLIDGWFSWLYVVFFALFRA